MLQMTTKDADGYAYDQSFTADIALLKYCKACDGKLLPLSKARGEIAFEVPQSVKGLQFLFQLDAIGGTIVVFDIAS